MTNKWNEAQRNVRKKITMTRPFHPGGYIPTLETKLWERWKQPVKPRSDSVFDSLLMRWKQTMHQDVKDYKPMKRKLLQESRICSAICKLIMSQSSSIDNTRKLDQKMITNEEPWPTKIQNLEQLMAERLVQQRTRRERNQLQQERSPRKMKDDRGPVHQQMHEERRERITKGNANRILDTNRL